MVNVNKPIAKGEGNVQSTPKRRPRNTELNSSKKTSGQGKLAALKKRKLNCSVGNIPAEYEPYYEVISDQEFADTVGTDVDNLREIVAEIENEYNEKVVGYLTAKTKYADAFVDANIDSGFITESGKVLNGSDEGYIGTGEMKYAAAHVDDEDSLDSACGDKDTANSSLNCESDTAKVTGTVTIYNDFADLDNDTTERLLRSRIEKAVPTAKVDFEKINDTDVKVKIDCPDADAEKVRLAVESSDVTKSVDWESATEELDSARNSDKTTEGTVLNSSEEPEGDVDGGEAIGESSGESATITTESGNEVSISDIQIIQNPDTNELSLFIKEDEDEEIPEGFVVIATATQAALPVGDTCPNCGQDPCVCEGEGGEDEGELDSSKKKNELNCSSSSGLIGVATEYYEDEHDALIDILQTVDDLGYGDSVYQQLIKNYGYEGTDAQQADEALIKMASEDADEHDFLVSLIQAIEDLGYGKQVYTEVLGIGGDVDSSLNSAEESLDASAYEPVLVDDEDETYEYRGFYIYANPAKSTNPKRFYVENERDNAGPFTLEDAAAYVDSLRDGSITDGTMNSNLGSGDGRQDATSQVTVPKRFPDDKVHDLYRWVESELWNEGIDVDVYGVGRPSAGVISFDYEVVGKTPAEVDAIIEDRVQEFIQNGYQGLQYPEGDLRHGLNSEKHRKSLNCKVKNARVEPTEQGTWVVKADTDRFGKDAILYEHYSEEGANKYLDRLKTGGDAVANGYSGHIDHKNVEFDSGDDAAGLNSSVHDNPALKTLVEKIRPVCSQVSAVPTTENGISGYKLIVRGAQADDIEPLAKEQGIEFASLKPLEDGFAVTITADALANSNVDPDAEFSEEGALRYRDYLITGTDKGGYVAVSPYGKFSPKVYKSIDEAKAAIDADMKVRFPET